MTAPFSPHPQPLIWIVVIGMLGVAIAVPIARREDAIGWMSFITLAGFALFLWVLLVFRQATRLLEWLRHDRSSDKAVIPQARFDEIKSWLAHQVAFDDAAKQLCDLDRQFHAGSPRFEDDLRRLVCDHFREGDQLWEYDTGPDSWENLCGERGYAIVRSGEVVAFIVIMEN